MTKLDEFLDKANVHSHAISCDKELGLDHWIYKAKEIIRKQAEVIKLIADFGGKCIDDQMGVMADGPCCAEQCRWGQREIEEMLK